MIDIPIPALAMPPANDLLAESDLEQATGLSPVGAADGRRFPRYYFRALAVATMRALMLVLVAIVLAWLLSTGMRRLAGRVPDELGSRT